MSATDSIARFNAAAQAHGIGMARLLDALKEKDAELAKSKADAAAAEKERDDAVNQLSDYLEKSTGDIDAVIGPAPAASGAADAPATKSA